MVQQELKEAMQMGEMLEKTGNNVWIGALTAEGAAYGPDWKVRGGSCFVDFAAGARGLALAACGLVSYHTKIPVRSLTVVIFLPPPPLIYADAGAAGPAVGRDQHTHLPQDHAAPQGHRGAWLVGWIAAVWSDLVVRYHAPSIPISISVHGPTSPVTL